MSTWQNQHISAYEYCIYPKCADSLGQTMSPQIRCHRMSQMRLNIWSNLASTKCSPAQNVPRLNCFSFLCLCSLLLRVILSNTYLFSLQLVIVPYGCCKIFPRSSSQRSLYFYGAHSVILEKNNMIHHETMPI